MGNKKKKNDHKINLNTGQGSPNFMMNYKML